MKKEFFGTDGIRAKVGTPIMHPHFLLQLGNAIGLVLMQKNETHEPPCVYIGRDTRLSGEMLEKALISGLLSSGCHVTQLGVMPTPAIAYLTKKHHAATGIIISASHNSFEDNGIKCIGPTGMKFSDEWEVAVETHLKHPMRLVDQAQIGILKRKENLHQEYRDYCFSHFKFLLKKNIVIDCANGATYQIAPMIFNHFAKCDFIHKAPDGMNINKHCGATHLESLQKNVLEQSADLGIAFDGDGDRVILVDHTGEIVDGDEILGILACHGAFEGVVGTVMTNLGLEKMLAEKNISFQRTAVGDRHVLSELIKNGWKLGGEASGHIINLQYAQTGDGILSALQVLKIMHDTQQSLHALKKVIQKRPQILINVPLEQPKRFYENEQISKAVSQLENELGENGRLLLRASGTESCLRIMVECDDENQALSYAKLLEKTVKTAFFCSEIQ